MQNPKILKILKIVLGGLAALVVVVTAVGFLLPREIRVEREVLIDAPPESIYPLIADLEEGWSQWSPWRASKLPGAVYEYSGPKVGLGATQVFRSDDDGDGKLTIVKADPSRGVEYDLWLMNETFKLKGSLLCEPKGERTRLVWTDDIDYGNNPYYRYFGLIIEGPLGNQLQEGLTELKKTVETDDDNLAAN